MNELEEAIYCLVNEIRKLREELTLSEGKNLLQMDRLEKKQRAEDAAKKLTQRRKHEKDYLH